MAKEEQGKRADVAGWTDEFVGTVFPAEYETIMARRREVVERTAAREAKPFEAPPDRSEGGPLVPSVKLRLFGLSFSGGGIRSATFNLGIIQALAKQGLLSRIDYLSTVSGGGYIGSCISSLLNRPEADSEWTKAFPLFLESGRQEPIGLRHLRNNSSPLLARNSHGIFGGIGVFLRGMLVNILAIMPLVVLLVGLTHLAYGEQLVGGLRAGLHSYTLTLGALAVFVVGVALFPLVSWVGGHTKRANELSARRSAGSFYGVMLKLVLVFAVVESLPLVLRLFHQSGTLGSVLESLTGLSVLGTALPKKSSDGTPGIGDKIIGILIKLAAVAAAPLLLVLSYAVLGEWVVYPGSAPMGDAAPLVVYGAGAGVFLYMVLFLDANATSIYQYYRDRLSFAYLFQVEPNDHVAVRSTDRLRLSELNAEGTVAPYHLLNTTLNLQSSTDVELRGRMADFFFFSKHYTGSIRTGFCATKELEAVDRRVDLGTALAISGAAASPNMGTSSIPPLALLMTLLNVRLGYWLPNPKRVKEGKGGFMSNIGAGLRQLLSEAMSRADEHGSHVNVTDGAHIENLGVYELLRRRCKVIICGDAEADPDMCYHGLSTVIRYAATDMGVHIDINLEGLDTDANGRSKKHYAIGRIDYGDGEEGWLLYVKLSIGQRELPYIEQYRSANPEFPHQPTSDQFFDEAQFEAYRALGFKVGLRTMEGLSELKKVASEGEDEDEDEMFDFGTPGATTGERVGVESDPMAAGLSKRFRPAADAQPPW